MIDLADLDSQMRGAFSSHIMRLTYLQIRRPRQCTYCHSKNIVVLKLTHYLHSAWIGSIQYALVFIPGVFTGRLVDLGYFRVPFSIGSAFVVIAAFLTAQCTKYWQFLLCQGIFLGVRLAALSMAHSEC